MRAQYQEIPLEPTLSRRLGVSRPDPIRLASQRADLAYQEAHIEHLKEQQRLAKEHLTALAREQSQQVEAVRTDRARLAGLDILAREAGGQIPDPEAEEERRRLRVRLEERPASLAAALEADVARLDGEVKQLTGAVASGRQQLAKEEDLARRFAEEELEVAVDHVRKGVATVPQQMLVSKAGRWPEPER
jgi:hypothetical protein